jgi:hypothetical protein
MTDDVSERTVFEVETDAAAQAWLDAHPCASRTIDYEVRLCCGGGRLRDVHVRSSTAGEDQGDHVASSLSDGTSLLIDRRAAARLPSRFALTISGFGPFRHLDLVLSPEQWGRLLYD